MTDIMDPMPKPAQPPPQSDAPTPEEDAADHEAWKADEKAMLDTFARCAELIRKRLGEDTTPDGFESAMDSRGRVLTALNVLFQREPEPSAFDEMIRAFTKSFATPDVGKVIAQAYMDMMKPSPLPPLPPMPSMAPGEDMMFMSLTTYIRTLPKGELEKLATLIRELTGEPEGEIKA